MKTQLILALLITLTSSFSQAARINEILVGGHVALSGAQFDALEAAASPVGRAVVKSARTRIESDEMPPIKGSCWDYVDAVYNDAKFPQKKRSFVFKGKPLGPHADFNQVQPGDWLYITNDDGTYIHSLLFLGFSDDVAYRASEPNVDLKIGIFAGYAGGGIPGYGRLEQIIVDDLRVYAIIRGVAAGR